MIYIKKFNFFCDLILNRKGRHYKIAKTENNHSPIKDGKPPSAAAAALERTGSARNSPLTIALYSSMTK